MTILRFRQELRLEDVIPAVSRDHPDHRVLSGTQAALEDQVHQGHPVTLVALLSSLASRLHLHHASRAHVDLPDCQDLQALPEILVVLGRPDLLDPMDILGNQDSRDHQDQMESQELLVHQENLVKTVSRRRFDLGHPDYQDLQDHQDRREQWDSQAAPVFQVIFQKKLWYWLMS